MSRDIAIHIKNLSKTFVFADKPNMTIRDRVIHAFNGAGKTTAVKALDGINFDVYKGETLGIIGHNGCGKSTLLNIMLGSIKADEGSVVDVRGRVLRMALGLGFDLNLSARDNVYVNGSIMGLSFKRIGDIFHQVFEFAGLMEHIDTPIKFYSHGMKQRLAFSIARYVEADIYLMDEFFAGVGDHDFRKKSRDIFEQEFVRNKTVIFVSHNMNEVSRLCDRVLVVDKGKMIGIGDPKEMVAHYESHIENPKNTRRKN